MPDDERKSRRLGDETKGRIADLAAGWTVDGESPPAPELPRKHGAAGTGKAVRDAPRRKAKTVPPPPPGSPERKALEDKIAELTEGKHLEADAARLVAANPPAANPPAAKLPAAPPPVPRGRTKSGQAPAPGARSPESGGAPGVGGGVGGVPEVAVVAEVDKTKENRGAVGIGHDTGGSLTANSASGTIGGDTPPPIFDRAAIAAGQQGALATEWVGAPGSGPTVAGGAGQAASARGTPRPALPDQLAVPVGEFEHTATILDQDKLRIAHAQATIVRDAASALLGVAEPLTEAERPSDAALPDATHRRGDTSETSASATGRFERADPTLGDERGDATATSVPASGHAPSGTLRDPAALPRRRGILGDVRYVATVVFGLRAARRELAEITARQATRQQSRRHHLVTLGRTAVALPEFIHSDPERKARPGDGLDHPALGPAREQLAGIEDERSQHAGHVVAADAELTRVRRDREAKAKQYGVDLAALDGELASFAKRLEPLEKDVAGLKKRAGDMHESLRRIDAKIAATEASLTEVKRGGTLDRAAIQAEIASLRADRKAIQADEPAIAGELDALTPRIAAIEAARVEAQRKRVELETAEQDDQRRVEELLTAIGAKRKVVDRAAADAEAMRDRVLFQLGDRLYVDRPADLAAQLAPIDEIDVELGMADRRIMELREILSSVHRWKLARGIALIVLLLAALGALAGWLVLVRPW